MTVTQLIFVTTVTAGGGVLVLSWCLFLHREGDNDDDDDDGDDVDGNDVDGNDGGNDGDDGNDDGNDGGKLTGC